MRFVCVCVCAGAQHWIHTGDTSYARAIEQANEIYNFMILLCEPISEHTIQKVDMKFDAAFAECEIVC